ncbi:hypothetical protein OESDEN_04092 [Oesophagostomum dentatum]|uniref:Methyltransferase domain-containing protein n=1 Tax=Oesophagostomum dentatum TaxID=61180 RepID=A0A0B1TFB9_OESDE|nr:hypothetical protein OESDEN_04092 [Oesophagostomum dentatum]
MALEQKYTKEPIGVRSAWVRHYYEKQSQQRVELLQAMGNAKDFRTLYNVIVPEVQCPNLVRVGTVLDGGKYVCNPLSLPEGMCRIYSLGLSHQITFDQEIYDITGKRCRIHGYDVHPPSLAVKKAYESMNGTLETKFISRSKGNRILGCFMLDYALFSYEINPAAIRGCEYCFIHVDCMQRYGAVELKRYLNLIDL